MALDRVGLKKLLKEKGVKSLDDFNAFMRDVSKDVVETLMEEGDEPALSLRRTGS